MDGDGVAAKRETVDDTSNDRQYFDGAFSVERRIGREVLRIQTGVLAKQAHGSVFVTYGDSAVLVTATTAKPWREVNFFPLTVDYRERTPAAGKFPGGFIKREGRPTDKEVLTCRCIDRPIRPLFEAGFTDEVQVLCNVLSADAAYDPDVLAMIGAFASLYISKIPFNAAGASIRVGMKDDELILMPTYEEREGGELDLVVAGTTDALAMVEAGAAELPEEAMLEAIEYGHEAIQEMCAMLEELREAVGKPKIEVTAPSRDQELYDDLRDDLWDELRDVILTSGKFAQKAALKALCERKTEEILSDWDAEDPERAVRARAIRSAFQDLTKERGRRMVVDEDLRMDGRALNEVRDISISLGILPRVHGSAVFTRGETQALASVTLGTQQDEQRQDGLRDPTSKRFYLHYNFPPFCVGEVKPIRGPGRREIGHGMLAERGLSPLIPDSEEFPYTIRVISDILESNGSSSMATVCAGSLAMMHAGVPMREPVAGIAMGLISEKGTFKVLSDILGEEDHSGDMDFKVTGTTAGVTALQMDIKVEGLTMDLLRDALEQAREGRLHILGCMNELIESARTEMHPLAPRVIRREIPVDKIALLIGPGGRNIRAIQERTGTNLEVNDTGEVLISGTGESRIDEAARYVESFTKDVELGEEFQAEVVDIRDFGAFVELSPGKQALCHVSELSEEFVENVTDVVNLGDTLKVRVINIDPTGKIKVSAKAKSSGGDGERGGGRPPRDRESRGRPRRDERPPRGEGRGRRDERPRRDDRPRREDRPRGEDRPRRDDRPRREDRPPRGEDRPPRGEGRSRDDDRGRDDDRPSRDAPRSSREDRPSRDDGPRSRRDRDGRDRDSRDRDGRDRDGGRDQDRDEPRRGRSRRGGYDDDGPRRSSRDDDDRGSRGPRRDPDDRDEGRPRPRRASEERSDSDYDDEPARPPRDDSSSERYDRGDEGSRRRPTRASEEERPGRWFDDEGPRENEGDREDLGDEAPRRKRRRRRAPRR